MGNVKHSITLYGFGFRYVNGILSFEDIMAKAKKLGADGIEIVAPQMVIGHPNPSDEWIAYFKDTCAKYGLTPVCYSIYTDNGKFKGRFMNESERMLYTINEMAAAKKMGFTIVRTQEGLMPGTMEKLLPYAEELGLHLAIELHGPHTPTSSIWMEYYEMWERKKSEHLGIVMDFSSFASGAPATVLNKLPDEVCNKKLLLEINALYATTEIPEAELEKMILDKGGDEADKYVAREKIFSIPADSRMGTIFHRTHPDYDGFRRLLKYSKYMHGKFHYVDENLNCNAIDYPRFVKIMKEENYKGYIASEYEGDAFDNNINDEEQIARHIRMLEKLWAES